MSPRTRQILSERGRRARLLIIAGASLGALAGVGPAWARSAEPGGSADACAVVQDFEGSAQILDEDRTELAEVGESNTVPCGGWVSVDTGWVILKVAGDKELHLARGTFARIPGGAPVVLFRGEAYARNLEVTTPNAVAKAAAGGMLVIFDTVTESTQLVALDGLATLRNRFGPSRPVAVPGGDASILVLKDIKRERLVPQSPRPVAWSSLQPNLAALAVKGRVRDEAKRLAEARIRQSIVKVSPGGKKGNSEASRSPAGSSSDVSGDGRERPEGEAARQAMTPKLRRALRRSVGGEAGGESLAFPRKSGGPQVDVTVEGAERRKVLDDLEAIKQEP